MTFPVLQIDQQINCAPENFAAETELPNGLAKLLERLHATFTNRQQKLVSRRAEVLEQSLNGDLPNYLPASAAVETDWQIVLPVWAQDQRNQMTGPADDIELTVKMLNSGAPGVMLDLEDSMANRWENLTAGIENVVAALHGELQYFDRKRDQKVSIKQSNTVIFTRARGLHLNQAGIFTNELMSASVFDVASVCFRVDRAKLKHPVCFYIPKSESAEEALFWRDLFQTVEAELGWKKGFIKCMALVEAHPLAFQMEEFLFNLREHIIGLNLGRWDYMASLIHFNLSDPAWVLPDRNTIPSDIAFFQNLRHLLVETCHKYGALAIGGMTALFPNRADAELNERALTVLRTDKNNEAAVGMDGAWTGHPDQNQVAVEQFPHPNQIDVRKPELAKQPDLRPAPENVGKKTVQGTRAAARTAIRYRNGVLNGKGASLLDGYMEDLATDRIYRLMIAQRIQHRDVVQVFDENGEEVSHTPEFVTQIFDGELEKLLSESAPETHETLREARRLSEEMIVNNQHDPV